MICRGKPLRNMVSQPENKLDLTDIMDSGKIFLAKLSEGLCGAENSYLLGTLLVSKFQQLAMVRQSQAGPHAGASGIAPIAGRFQGCQRSDDPTLHAHRVQCRR